MPRSPKPKPWPFVYRVIWASEERGAFTRRVSERGAQDWIDIFKVNRDYAVSNGREWKDALTVERAPVGEWEVIFKTVVDEDASQTEN